jgi:DNA-binding transcriptional LysR family regulator
MDDELVLVCGSNHYLYNSSAILLNELTGIDFVVREQGSGTRELFDSLMAANDINWTIKWECNGSDALKNAAINGVGVAVISKLLVEKEVAAQELSIINVDGLDLKRKFSIVYHKNKYITDSMRALMDVCLCGDLL